MEGLNFEQTPSAPVLSPRKKNPKRFFMLLGAIIVILILLFGAFNLLGGDSSTSSDNITPTPTGFVTETLNDMPTETPTEVPTVTPTAKETPTPSVAESLDRSLLDVAVQNGSGVTGAAKTASDYLEELGYSVVSTGNADTDDFVNVTIQIKSTKSNYLALLKKDLSAKYTVGTTSSDLPSSSTEDALVIIGQ